jgi:hypothetical protein
VINACSSFELTPAKTPVRTSIATEPQKTAHSRLCGKKSEVVGRQRDTTRAGVEMELNTKWDRRLDELVPSIINVHLSESALGLLALDLTSAIQGVVTNYGTRHTCPSWLLPSGKGCRILDDLLKVPPPKNGDFANEACIRVD